MLVADEIDVLDADLGPSVHVEVHPHGATDHGIPHGIHVHFHLQVTLFLIIALDDIYGSILHIFRVFPAGTQVQTLLEILLFSGLDTGIRPAGYAGTFPHHYLEPGGIGRCIQGIHHHGHVFKITLGHQAPDDAGDVLSGDGDGLSLLQAHLLQNLMLVEILVPFDSHAAHYI